MPGDDPPISSASGSTSRSRTSRAARATSAASSADVAVGPSPVWLRARLHAAGMRSISNVVDVTNYVMHALGSPLHAFDRATLAGGPHRRPAREAGRGDADARRHAARRSTERDLVIADAERPVALAGDHGRRSTARSATTTTEVLLEAANFEPIGVLRTSERLGLRTEALEPLGEGRRPDLAEPAAVLASRLIVDLAGAELDRRHRRRTAACLERPVVRLRPERTDAVVGLEVAAGRAARDPRAARLRRRRRLGRDGADLARARRDARDRPRRGGRARRPRPGAVHDAAAAPRARPADAGAAAAPARRGRPRRRRLRRGLHLEPRGGRSATRTRSGSPIR